MITLESIRKESEEKLRVGNSCELGQVLFDTLVGNKRFPQFDMDKVGDCEVDTRSGKITLDYCGYTYTIETKLKKVKKIA